MASEEWIKKLYENGQIATRYVDADGNVQLNDEEWNVNGSYYAIEGITSPDVCLVRWLMQREEEIPLQSISLASRI